MLVRRSCSGDRVLRLCLRILHALSRLEQGLRRGRTGKGFGGLVLRVCTAALRYAVGVRARMGNGGVVVLVGRRASEQLGRPGRERWGY